MQKKIFGVVAIAMMALTGCASTCDDLEDAYGKAQNKARPCASAGSPVTPFNTNQCENNLDKCSDSEKKALGNLADCLRDLPECTPATVDNFNNAVIGCAFSLAGKVGQNCASAIITSSN